MRRYDVEPRDAWLERVQRAGVVLGARRSCPWWNERCCVAVSASDADTLYSHAEDFYAKMTELTDHAIEVRYLDEFDFSFEERRIIARSWAMSDHTPTLFTRLDYRVDDQGSPRVVGVSSGLRSGLLETAVAQWDWLRESTPWATQFNTISERLTESWREYRLAGRVMHVGYDLRDQYGVNMAEYVWDSAISAGVLAIAVPLEELRVDGTTGDLIDPNGGRVDILITARDLTTYPRADLWTFTSQSDICLVEPHWKRLWDSGQWLPYCDERMSGHERSKSGNVITLDGRKDLWCSIWIVAGKVSGLGLSQREGARREFLPHMLLAD